MSNTIAYVDNQTLTNIADAVRSKTGTNEKMLLSDIPNKIRNIDGIIPSGTQVITENGTYNVEQYASAVVDVPDKVLISESVLERDVFGEDARESYWVKNFIPIDQNEYNLYEIVFQNNTAPTHTAVRMISLGRKLDTFSSANGCFLWRMSDGVVQRYCTTFDMNYGNSTARNLHASAGTIIKVYKLQCAF